MPSRSKSARAGGMKRCESLSFEVTEAFVGKLPQVRDFLAWEATLVIQQNGPLPTEFECRLELSKGSRTAACEVSRIQCKWLKQFLPKPSQPTALQSFDLEVGLIHGVRGD